MQIPTYFLDTNVWSALANDQHTSVADRLRELTSDERILVTGSGELLEEFAPIDGRGQQHFATMLDLFWSCTNGKLFLSFSDFMRAEVHKGSRMSLKEALLNGQIVSKLREHVWTEPIWHGIAIGVGDQKSDYVEKMARTNPEVAEGIAASGSDRGTKKVSPERRIDKDEVNFAFRSLCSAEWSELGLRENADTWPRGSALPAVSVGISFVIALAKRALAENRKAQRGDSHDVIHCAHAAYTDGLVTMEKKLVLAAEQIEWPKLPIIRGEDFFDQINETSSRAEWQ